MFLKTHLGDETIEHFRNLLSDVSYPPGRIKIYESMGFFGGSANASLLSHYLQAEDEIDAKAQIICSLGHVGTDAAQIIRQIEDTKNAYARHHAARKSQEGSIVVRSGNAEWAIDEYSMPPERFSLIANESLKRIQAKGQAQ